MACIKRIKKNYGPKGREKDKPIAAILRERCARERDRMAENLGHLTRTELEKTKDKLLTA